MRKPEGESSSEEGDQQKTSKFQIGRSGPHKFKVYETVVGEEAAMRAYRDTIKAVASPSEIKIYEVAQGESPQPHRRDLEQRGTPRTEKRIEDITLEDSIDMDTARALGCTRFHGTTWVDYHGQAMSLDEMAKDEATSLLDAQRRRLQTAVDPSRGNYVSWVDPNSRLARAYKARVEKYVEGKK